MSTSESLIVRNALIPTIDDAGTFDIVSSHGKIQQILPSGTLQSGADQEFDAGGGRVLPGLIDPHVHMGNGHQSLEEDLASETRMAVAGGATALFPFIISRDGYDDIMPGLRDAVERASLIDIFPQIGIVNASQIALVPKLYAAYGIRAFKCFMGYKGADASPSGIQGIDDPAILELMCEVAKIPGGRLAVHAENMEIVQSAREHVQSSGQVGLEGWTRSRPQVAESEAILRVLHFARTVGCAVTIPHISVGSDLALLRRGAEGVDAVFETCPHYLLLTPTDPIGVWGKVNPPLREPVVQDALWDGVVSGPIDTVGSDHCPFTSEVKGADGSLWDARAGIPNGTALILSTLLDRQSVNPALSTRRIAELTSTNAAGRYGLGDVKGQITVGADADMVVLAEEEFEFRSAGLGGVSTVSPYDGRRFTHTVRATIARGRIVYAQGGEVVAEPAGHARMLTEGATQTGRN